MKYIFDVDETLFDTEKFRQDAEPYKADGTWVTPGIWDVLDAADYLYPDVLSYIESLGKENVILLTAVTPDLGPESEAFQKAKVEQSGLFKLASQTIFMEGLKGPHIKELAASSGPMVFVDDREIQLQSAREYAPEVLAVRMERKLTTGGGQFESIPGLSEFPKITSLEALDTVIAQWKQEPKTT